MKSFSIARVTTAGVGALLLVAMMLLGAAGQLPGSEETPVRPARPGIADGQLPAGIFGGAPPAPDQDLPPGVAPRVDLQGDEISPAIASYGIDCDGNLFEVHSPQTEEPRLGSPIG